MRRFYAYLALLAVGDNGVLEQRDAEGTDGEAFDVGFGEHVVGRVEQRDDAGIVLEHLLRLLVERRALIVVDLSDLACSSKRSNSVLL